MSSSLNHSQTIMDKYNPDLEVLLRPKLSGSFWCHRRYRRIVRLDFQEAHPGSPKMIVCRTTPEAAAYANAAYRTLREHPARDPRVNDFIKLFQRNRKSEGPDGAGACILMIEPPCCWVKVSEGRMPWLWDEDWFVDPRTERPVKVKLVQRGTEEWEWVPTFLDEYIWLASGREGTPYHRNGDQMDCRIENLAASPEAGLIPEPPLRMPEGKEKEICWFLSECETAIAIDQRNRVRDPWDLSEGLIQDGDQRWLIEVLRRRYPGLAEDAVWKERVELVDLLMKPWKIPWAKHRRL